MSEADVPAQQPQACEEARLPVAHVDPSWSSRAAEPAPQGPPPPVGLIWRLRGQASFRRLRREGRRLRSGPIVVTYVLDPHMTPPQVAFAIGRPVGPAVVRNRLRRQLRAQLRALAGAGSLPAGLYLVGVRPGVPLTPEPIRNALDRAISQLGTVGEAPPPGGAGR